MPRLRPLYTVPFRYPKAVRLVVVALLLLGAVGIPRITWVQDISSLLPDRDDTLVSLAREWGMMKSVTVVVGPAQPGNDAIFEALDDLSERLAKLPGTASVTPPVSPEAVARAVRLLTSRSARLVGTVEAEHLSAEEARRRLDALKKRLAAPEAMMMGKWLLADPLGFSTQALSGLGGAGAAMGTEVERGRLLSADRRYGILPITVSFDPMDPALSREYVRTLDATLAVTAERTGLSVRGLGGVYFADVSASVMMRDIRTAFIFTTLLVILVFVLFFRNLRMILPAMVPSSVGIVAALGVMGLCGVRLHAVTVGFASTICGIAVDYVIHLLYRAKSLHSGTGEARMTEALRAILRPVTLGFLTTESAFAIVAFSGFTGVRQMAIFSLISLPTAFFVALFAVPTLHRFLLKDRSDANSTISVQSHVPATRFLSIGDRLNRKIAVAVFTAVFCGAAVEAGRTVFSGDPRDLGYTDPVLSKREAFFRKTFPGLFQQAVLVSAGNTPDAALQTNDALYEDLREMGIPAGDIISVSPFLPSLERQKASQSRARHVLSRPDVQKAFTDAGFQPEYIESLDAKIDEPILSPADFTDTALAPLVDQSFHRDERGRHYCLTRVRLHDDNDLDRLAATARSAGARLVSERLETRNTLVMLQREIVIMLSIWLAAALIGVSLAQRSLLFGIRAVLPAIFGVLTAAAVFALLGKPLTAVASAGVTLVLGLAVDYGIFMQTTFDRERSETAGAVLASALTTAASFGVLASTHVRAMADIGLIILVGIFAAALTALLLVPALQKRKTS